MRSPLRSPAQVEGSQGFLPQPDGIKQITRILETEAVNQEQVEIQIKVKEYIKQIHDEISPMDFRDFNISKYRVEKMDVQNINAKKKDETNKKENDSKENDNVLNIKF